MVNQPLGKVEPKQLFKKVVQNLQPLRKVEPNILNHFFEKW